MVNLKQEVSGFGYWWLMVSCIKKERTMRFLLASPFLLAIEIIFSLTILLNILGNRLVKFLRNVFSVTPACL